MRILLVDDETNLLLALQRSLHQIRPDLEAVLAGSAAEALEHLRRQPFDLLVTDIRMPGMDGMALLAWIRAEPRFARIPVIFMTAMDDRESLRAGMNAGADDYLTKPFAPRELLAAVDARLHRHRSHPPQEAEAARERLARMLTARELEVLAEIGRGMVSKDIAVSLGISPRTVAVHRANLMRKLDMHNASALARLAVQARLA